jgi:putative ABC transport system permease protein
MKSNISFYICIIVLTALVTCIHVILGSAYVGQKKNFDQLLEDSKLEDAEFMTRLPIEDTEYLEKKYGVELEVQPYIDLPRGDSEAEVRVFAPSEKLNLYRVQQGKAPEKDNEILLSGLFMQAQGLSIGDEIVLSGKTYKICGEVVRTDYLFCLKNDGDTFSDSERFGVGAVSGSAFSGYDKMDMATIYAVKYGDGTDIEAFRKDVNEQYDVLSYLRVENNMRIQTPKEQFNELDFAVKAVIPGAMVFMVILIAVVLGRKIRNERKMIGVLHALGYKRYELALHYSVMGAIPGFVGGLLGCVLALPLIGPMADTLIEGKMEVFYEIPSIAPSACLVALFLPTACYVLAVFVTALVNMRGSAIDMIKGLSKNKKKRLGLRKAKMSFRSKYKLRAVFGHFPRTLLVILGLAIGGMLVAFCFACVDSIQNYIDTGVKATGEYEYEYFLSSIRTGNPEKGSAATGASFEVPGNADLITMLGLDEDRLLNVKDSDGRDLPLEDGKFYISEMSAYCYHLKAGDTITLQRVSDLQQIELKVEDVFVNGSQSLIVGNRKTVNELLGLPGDAYTVVMSREKIDYRDSEVVREISKSSMAEALDKTINKGMKDVLFPISILAMIISAITTYLMVNILLSESTGVISMLKVLGYRDGEINRIVTYIYHALLPIGVALGVWLGLLVNKLNFQISAATYNTYIDNYVTKKSILICVVIPIISYVISMVLLNKKVKNVEMTESLKVCQE